MDYYSHAMLLLCDSPDEAADLARDARERAEGEAMAMRAAFAGADFAMGCALRLARRLGLETRPAFGLSAWDALACDDDGALDFLEAAR
jgi:hypothetical protein